MFHRSFKYLWFSRVCSNTANIFSILTIVTVIYGISGSAAYAAVIPLCRVVSQSISGLLAPLLLDRYPLTLLLKSSQFVQFTLFIAIAWFTWQGLSSNTLWILLLLIFVTSFFDGWTTPASNSLIPRLVPDARNMTRANGLFVTTNYIVQLAGWAGGAIIISFVGAPYMLLAVGILFAIAFGATSLIREPEMSGVEKEKEEQEASSSWDKIREGWMIIWHHRQLRALVVMDAIEGLGSAAWIGAFMLVYVKTVLHQSEAWWGYVNAAYFVGAIGGGLLMTLYGDRMITRRFLALMISMIGYGVLTALFGVNANGWLALVMTLLMGPFTEVRAVLSTTMIQLSVSADKLPKVLAANATLSFMWFGISVLGLGLVTDYLGITAMYVLCGGISIVAAIVGWVNRKYLQEQNNSSMSSGTYM